MTNRYNPLKKAGRWTILPPLPSSHISNSEKWGLNPLWLGLHSVSLALILSLSTLSCPTRCTGSRTVGLLFSASQADPQGSRSCAPSLGILHLEPAPWGLGGSCFPFVQTRLWQDLCSPQSCCLCVQLAQAAWNLSFGGNHTLKMGCWLPGMGSVFLLLSLCYWGVTHLERDLNFSICLVMNFWPWAEHLIWFLDKIASVFCDWCWSLSNHFLLYSLCHSALTCCFSRKSFGFLNICLKNPPPNSF